MPYYTKITPIIAVEDWKPRLEDRFLDESEANLTGAPECIFCEIVSGQSEASIVFQDDLVTVFMDIHPVNPGHLLVVPNEHASSIDDVPEDACARMFIVGRRMARALRGSGLRCEGVNLLLADGAAAGQDVFHSHLHVIPRFQGNPGSVRMHADFSAVASRQELDAQAEAIRSSLDAAGDGLKK
jgi:diadenosine tetraphosphate (Ap4A) HIT family hydrolase